MKTLVRPAHENDIPRLTEIYNHHVVNGHSTFQLEPQTIEQRIKAFNRFALTGRYRMLVAEQDDRVVGSASSFKYRAGSVFERTVETGIYLDHRIMGKGIGSQLYHSLFKILAEEDIHLAVVGIALPNDSSIALHQKFGFKQVGVFDEYAYVAGKYYSSIWLQKRLNETLQKASSS